MNEKNDLLYQVFEKHLLKHSNEEEHFDTFAELVVDEYLMVLIRQGVVVPIQLRPILEMDLIEDVIDMIRKKTYGHMTIQEFRQKNATKIESFLKKQA